METALRPVNRSRAPVWPAGGDELQRVHHILIASDDDQLRDVVDAVLGQVGYARTFVRSGVDVVNGTYPRRRLGLVLLDQCLRDVGVLEVARVLSADTQLRFVLVGQRLTTSVTVAAMRLGAFTVLEKPVAPAEIVALLYSVVDESRTAQLTNGPPRMVRAPGSVAERWALKVMQGCEADRDLKTLSAWANVAGLSCSSLCEICRLLNIQPLAARDLTRVLRAVVQSRVNGCRIGELLDICDRRTLNALMTRAGVDPRRRGSDISVEQFLASQGFVPASNAGVAMLSVLLPR